MTTRDVITIVGTAVGFAVGYPQLGFLAGSLIGNAVDPVQIKGPRLEDLKTTALEYGSVVPHLYGSQRLAGVIVWSSDKQEVESTDSGKGGPETTTYTYKQDVLYMLTSNEIVGVRRIWSNGKLVWSFADDATSETIAASGDTISWEAIEVFNGSASQSPWTVYEAAVGVGNAPAMRGRGCVGITGLNLGGSGYAPQLTFEVLTNAGDTTDTSVELFEHVNTLATGDVQNRVGSVGWRNRDRTVQVLAQNRYSLRGGGDSFDIGIYGLKDNARIAGEALLPVTQVSPNSNLISRSLVSEVQTVFGFPGGFDDFVFTYFATFLDNIDGVTIHDRYDTLLVRGKASDGALFTSYNDLFEVDAEPMNLTGNGGVDFAEVAVGTSDESCVIANDAENGTGVSDDTPDVPRARVRFTSSQLGGVLIYGAPFSQFGAQWTYTALGDYLWMAIRDFGPRVVYRFSKLGGSPIATSVDIGQYVYTMATDGTALWVQTSSGIYTLDALTLFISADPPIGTPSGLGSFPTLSSDENGNLHFFGQGLLYRRNFDTAAWDLILDIGTEIDSGIPYSDAIHPPVYVRGNLYIQTTDVTSPTVTNRAFGAVELLSISPIPLSDVVSDLCVRSGLEESYLDVTELEDTEVRGFAISSITTARQAIETLMASYLFNAFESDKLTFVLRGGTAVETVPYLKLGAAEDTGVQEEPLPLTRRSDVEIPAQISVTFANFLADYQSATEYSDRLIGESTGVAAVQLPIVLTPAEAKKIADTKLLDGAMGATTIGPVTLANGYEAITPTDVLNVIDENGSTFRVRIEKITDAVGVRSLDLVLDDASILVSAALTSEEYTGSTVVNALLATLLALGDWPILRDSDNDAGHYIAVGPVASEGVWPGSVVYRGIDDLDYAEQATITSKTVIGEATTVLGDWTGGTVFDEFNSVTVSVNAELQSYSRDAILNGTADPYVLGAEVFFARNATFVSTGVYTLTGLLRGRRGTEWAMSTHATEEVFVRLQTSGLRRGAMESGQLGSEFSFKAPTIGKSLSSATEKLFTNTGVGLKPFAPVDLRYVRDATTDDVTLTWKRRTRLSTRFTGTAGINVPLGESIESYSIDVLTADSPPVLLRTLTATTESVVYTAAQQYDDGLTIGEPFVVAVYQLSTTVGRGYALDATVS